MVLTAMFLFAFGWSSDSQVLLQECASLAAIPDVDGSESLGWISLRLGEGVSTRDKHGNLVVRVGSGSPSRLIAVPVDEPGYVVSRITPDGFLRIQTQGLGPLGRLGHQFIEGQKVVIQSDQGLIPGVVAIPSIHLLEKVDGTEPFDISNAYIDVGAASAEEVNALGIRVLDPITLVKRPVILADQSIAGPSMRAKAAAVGLIHTARSLLTHPSEGTTTLIWYRHQKFGSYSLNLLGEHGPFDEVFLFSQMFGVSASQDGFSLEKQPSPGTALLGDGPICDRFKELSPQFVLSLGQVTAWKVQPSFFGLPVADPFTPVERVEAADVSSLVDLLVRIAGGKRQIEVATTALPPHPLLFQSEFGEYPMVPILRELLSVYGVSGSEAPVRKKIQEMLRALGEPRVDAKGNLILELGKGEEHLVFIAHMDEVGFAVNQIRDDGRLELKRVGGLFPRFWEGQAALVHTPGGSIPAVVEPRTDYFQATTSQPKGPLLAYVGATSREEALALGIGEGTSTLTMPRQPLRLGKHRFTARALDDRVGCSALIQAARTLDPKSLKRRITLVWSVEEEIGLLGAKAVAESLGAYHMVHPVDTLVSNHAPRDTAHMGSVQLGEGAAIRAMDHMSLLPRSLVDRYLEKARNAGIPLQYGLTGGGSDGIAFLSRSFAMAPFSWPGRYSHSPIEVADLRDIEALVSFLVLLMTE